METAQRHRLVQQIRDQIRENPAQRVHQIYRDVLVNATFAAAAAQNQKSVNLRYDSIRSQLNRARNPLLPRYLEL